MRPKIDCPHCKKNVSSDDDKVWPFCCVRCKTNDLGDWASEKFRVASTVITIEENESEDDEDY